MHKRHRLTESEIIDIANNYCHKLSGHGTETMYINEFKQLVPRIREDIWNDYKVYALCSKQFHPYVYAMFVKKYPMIKHVDIGEVATHLFVRETPKNRKPTYYCVERKYWSNISTLSLFKGFPYFSPNTSHVGKITRGTLCPGDFGFFGLWGGSKSSKISFCKVRSTNTDTINACVDLLNEKYGAGSHYSKWIEGGFRPFTFDYMIGQVNNPLRELWVMKRSSIDIVGMIIIQQNGDHALFHKFCAREGVGSKLFKNAEQKATKMGFTKARVEVFTPAFKLVNYYKERGYTTLISYTQLQESEYVKYKNPINDYGFMMLEKVLKTE